MKHFENLAGKECNDVLQAELGYAGVTICDCSPFTEYLYENSELKNAKIYGNFEFNNPRNSWQFTRAWRYWVCKGYAGIPYESALKLYRDPDDIRILGGCGHPNQLVGLSPTSYHIDTWEGLRLFVEVLKEIRDSFKA